MLGMSSHEEYHFFIIIPYRGRMGKRGTCFFRDAMAVRVGGGCSDRDAGEQTRKLAVSHRRNHWLSTLPDVRVPGNGSHHRCVAALLCAMTVGLILVSALCLWAFVRARHVLLLFGRPVGLTITLPRWCRRRGPGTSRPWVFRRASVDSRIPIFSGELARPLTTGPPVMAGSPRSCATTSPRDGSPCANTRGERPSHVSRPPLSHRPDLYVSCPGTQMSPRESARPCPPAALGCIRLEVVLRVVVLARQTAGM